MKKVIQQELSRLAELAVEADHTLNAVTV